MRQIRFGRRQFMVTNAKVVVAIAMKSAIVGSAGFLLSGCAITIQDVANWVAEGSAAVQAVLTLLTPLGLACGVCAVAGPALIAAINAISGGIAEWEAAPAADKATTWAKIKLLMQIAFDQSSSFFTAINLPVGALLKTIISIASLVMSAISGFISKFFPALGKTYKLAMKKPTSLTLSSGGAIPYTPKEYTPAAFKSAFNTVVTENGHPEVVMY